MKDTGNTFVVAEAQPKDMGRAFARLDPVDLKKHDLVPGDIISIQGKKKSYCRAMIIAPDLRKKKVIQLDGVCRDNLAVSTGDTVEIAKVKSKTAQSITISPINITPDKRDINFIAGQLDGLPVVAGDTVRIILLGSRAMDFKVDSISPEGPVIIQPETELQVKKSQTKEKTVENQKSISPTYEDIGGLKGQLDRIRELIELPLRFPEIFQRLGIEPPRGVLLHGPPGCGKTLIARVIAHEAAANFFAINGPEVVHKFYGESEAHLRKIFEKAAASGPAIIFLDELDAIAPKREKAAGDVERRIVAQLLALMDGLSQRKQLIVIAATNIPHSIDPALRRPGRFDREIVIPVPDLDGRRKILEIHSRGMPLADDVSIDEIATATHGFVGADLAALCREAAMCSLRRVLPALDISSPHLPYEQLSGLVVTTADFSFASNEVEPSAVREVFVEVPNVKWSDVGGLEYAKQRLIESVEWPLIYPELFTKMVTTPAKGILLSGPPGCGKTLLARAIATESKVNFISVKGPALLSKYVGESEEGVRDIFKKARQAAPCVVFFDEIDALAVARTDGSGVNPVGERVLSQLLTEIDGIEELQTVLVLAASNRADMLDPAILRPGRFDEIIEIDLPGFEERKAVFAVHLAKRPLMKNVEFDELAELTAHFSSAEIAAVCNQAAMAALRREVGKVASQEGGVDVDNQDKLIITEEDLLLAIKSYRGEEGDEPVIN